MFRFTGIVALICVVSLVVGTGCAQRSQPFVKQPGPNGKAEIKAKAQSGAMPQGEACRSSTEGWPERPSAFQNEPGWTPASGFSAKEAFEKAFTGSTGKKGFPRDGSAPIAPQWIVGDLDGDNDIDDDDKRSYNELRTRVGGALTAQAAVWVTKTIPMARPERIDPSSLRQVSEYGLVARLPYGWIWIYDAPHWRDSCFTYDKVFDSERDAKQDLARFERTLPQVMTKAKREFRRANSVVAVK